LRGKVLRGTEVIRRTQPQTSRRKKGEDLHKFITRVRQNAKKARTETPSRLVGE